MSYREVLEELQGKGKKNQSEPDQLSSDSLRRKLDKYIQTYVDDNESIVSAVAIGSTAHGTENRYSDKDIGIVLSDDAALCRELESAGSRYSFFSEFVDWYEYTPFHHYVVFESKEGPVPLDIYYLTKGEQLLFSDPESVVLEPQNESGEAQSAEQSIRNLMSIGLSHISTARQDIEQGNISEAFKKIERFKNQHLATFMSYTLRTDIPHIKKIHLSKLDADVARLVIHCFSKPVESSLLESLQSLEDLISLLFHRWLTASPESTPPQTKSRENNEHREIVQLLGVDVLQNPLVAKTVVNLKHESCALICNDDGSLKVLCQEIAVGRIFRHDLVSVHQLSPFHWRIARLNESHKSIDVFVANDALYQNIKDNSGVLKDTELSSSPTRNNYAPVETALTDQEYWKKMFVKGTVRTFRLISKIVKNEGIAACYILQAIRSDQLLPILEQAHGLNPDFKVSPDELAKTYPRPVPEEILSAVKLMATLFIHAFMTMTEHFDLSDISRYIATTAMAIEDFEYDS